MHTAENQPVAPVEPGGLAEAERRLRAIRPGITWAIHDAGGCGRWGEIEIRGVLGLPSMPPIPGFDPAEHVDVGAAIAALNEFRAQGLPVALVRIHCAGGHTEAGMILEKAFSSFSAAGGKLITYVNRVASSSASAFALVADLRLMAPWATFDVHRALGWDEAGQPRPVDSLDLEADNQRLLAVYRQRTQTPAADLSAWVHLGPNDRGQPTHATLNAAAAISHGWVHAIVEPEQVEWVVLSMLAHRSVATLQTTNYAEDASGNPTAGAKLDHQGTAMKVAPGNLQIGSTVLSVLTSTAVMTVGAGWSLTINRVTRSFGVVGIHLNGTVQDQSSASWYAIGTIPEDYRPTHPTDNVSLIGRVLDSSTGASYVANFNIHPDGTVALFRYGNPLAMPFTIGNGDVVNLYGSFVRD